MDKKNTVTIRLTDEQFGGGKFFIQQNTIYRHERLVCPFALCVYLFGDVFLARDALAQYRDTQVRGRDLFDYQGITKSFKLLHEAEFCRK